VSYYIAGRVVFVREATQCAAESKQFCSIASMRNGVLMVQAALTVVCVAVAWLHRDQQAALAALYGGSVAAANSWLLLRRIATAGELAKRNLKYSVYSLYFGAIQRFLFVLVCLGVGLGIIKLNPGPLLLTFGIAQLAFMVAAAKEAVR
jgi:ATP synthase protein I